MDDHQVTAASATDSSIIEYLTFGVPSCSARSIASCAAVEVLSGFPKLEVWSGTCEEKSTRKGRREPARKMLIVYLHFAHAD